MNKLLLISLVVSSIASFSAMADNSSDNNRKQSFRMDCRFYDDKHEGHGPKYCVSHATYQLEFSHTAETELKNVRYGVRCDGKTIFDNNGIAFSTNDPDVNNEDHIRPVTSSVPKTAIPYQGALLKEGTYDAYIDLENKRIEDGSCDISEVDRQDP